MFTPSIHTHVHNGAGDFVAYVQLTGVGSVSAATATITLTISYNEGKKYIYVYLTKRSSKAIYRAHRLCRLD